MILESPSQILTRYAWSEKKRADMAGGTLESPTTLYLAAGGTTLGPALIVEPWPLDSRVEAPRIAHALLRGDPGHRDGCASGTFRKWERDSCGTCALLGWEAHAESGNPAPNWAGWARVYVQAREPVPRAWMPAFLEELNDEENTSYRDALRRDVATFGWRLTEERPGYRLPTPTGAKMLEWLRDYHGPDAEAEILEAVRSVIADADADYPAGPYDAASVRAARQALQFLEHGEEKPARA